MKIRRFQAGATAVAAAMLALGAILPAAAAAPKVTYHVWLDDSCISGRGPVSTKLIFDLRKPTGKLVDSFSATTGGDGAFDGCFPDAAPRTGLKLSARKKTTVLRTITLPRLTIKADRTTDKITVAATPGRRMALTVSDCNSSLSGCTSDVVSRTGTIGDKGTWTTDITTVYDALGHDPVEASFKRDGDTFHRGARFPYLTASGEVGFYGSANPGTTVKVTLKDAPGGDLLKAVTRTAGPSGGYQGTAATTAGRELSASFAADAKITIPVRSLVHTAGENTFDGFCLPDSLMAVYWWDGTQMAHGTDAADGTGAWSIDLDLLSFATPPAETQLSVTCNTPAGDQVTFQGVMPS